tara:strand:+ start:2413 stop:2817 length:405 start_codon:yes stop_codon:yes gene_type:complete
MSHFAQVIDGVVRQVIVAEQAHINTLPDKDKWIQTSFNTKDGKHLLGGTPLRGQFAAIGYLYNKDDDYFYDTRPYDRNEKPCVSWKFDKATYCWQPPVEQPKPDIIEDETKIAAWEWDEAAQKWIKVIYTTADG